MNPDSELMGDMRLADTVVGQLALKIEEVWQNGETMLIPVRAAELARIVDNLERSVKTIRPYAALFSDLAERRNPQPPPVP